MAHLSIVFIGECGISVSQEVPFSGVLVPYKGTALAVNDVLGGQLQASFVDALTAVKYVESNKLRAIGVSTAERNPALPNVPTIAEQGVPGYETEIWIGLYAPHGTPPAIVQQLNTIALAAMNDPGFKAMLLRQGTLPGTMDATAFGGHVRQEIAKWRSIVRDARIEPQ